MAEFKTPTRRRIRSRIEGNAECQTPIKIPASPFLKQIGYGCGVSVFTLERSPKVGFMRSPWAVKKRNTKLEKNSTYNQRIQLEAKILKHLEHPNVVGFRGFVTTQIGEPCLVMEKLDMSLGDLIETKLEDGDDSPFKAQDILYIGHEIAKGIEYLHHEAHILHGDIKSGNILLSKNLSIVKICDFGVCLPLNDDLYLDKSKGNYSYIGTECWTAPEVLFETGPTTNKADMWAYGLVIWEMLALSPPHITEDSTEDSMEDVSCDDSFSELTKENEKETLNTETNDDLEFFLKSKNKNLGTRPPLPAIEFSKNYNQVLEIFITCTDEDYKSRPSAKGLVMFFKNYVKSLNKK